MKISLSDREQEVIRYASEGFTDAMIAQALGIQVGTVNSYWVRIRGKLGHFSRTELVSRYVQANADEKTLLQAQETAAADERQAIALKLALAEIDRLKALLSRRKD